MFHVYLLPTPNLTALGECLMQVTSKEITLYDYCKSGRLITRWPLSSLRRYGREGLKFTIESGRSHNLMDRFYLHPVITNVIQNIYLVAFQSLSVINVTKL